MPFGTSRFDPRSLQRVRLQIMQTGRFPVHRLPVGCACGSADDRACLADVLSTSTAAAENVTDNGARDGAADCACGHVALAGCLRLLCGALRRGVL